MPDCVSLRNKVTHQMRGGQDREQYEALKVAAAEPPRIAKPPPQPLKAHGLKHLRGAVLLAGQEVKRSSDPYCHPNRKIWHVGSHPQFLFRSTQGHDHRVWLSLCYKAGDNVELALVALETEGRGIDPRYRQTWRLLKQFFGGCF